MTRSILRRGALTGLLCALATCAVSLIDPSFLGAEWLLRDPFARRLAASRPPDPRIVIVAVNQESVIHLAAADYGRPPYPRSLWATVIRELQRAGAKVIAIDLLFGEPNVNDPVGDSELAAAVQNAPVGLAAQTKPGRAAATPNVRLWQINGTPSAEMTAETLPMPSLRAAAAGTIRIAPSPHTATIHRYPVADRIGNSYLPSLGLEAARQFLDAPPRAEWTNDALLFAGRRIPVDEERHFALQFHRGEAKTDLSYPAVSVDKVLVAALAHDDPTLARPAEIAALEAKFRGKIVFIAYTAAGLFDLRATPLSPFTAGVELHANAADDILNNRFDRLAPRALVLPLIAIIAALFGMLIDATRSQLASGFLAAGVVAAIVGAGYALLASGLIVPTVAAIAAIVLTYVVITVINFVAEQEQSVMIRTVFGRYVSPQILDHVLAHPEKVRLGGERRDLTILFSDIRGFTSISEASEPEQVVEMLNEYLTKMVEILLAHGGTLDKFIGDAVMGFWNAPAPNPNHARNAVLCAIEMIEETARLRERWEAEGKAAIRIGIGINTGDAVVGNIGAEQVFGYTVIGDAVNLASRLEGKNKDYVTEIIISEFTLARIGDEFETVYLDDVKVKGKEKAVKIYEVKGVKHA